MRAVKHWRECRNKKGRLRVITMILTVSSSITIHVSFAIIYLSIASPTPQYTRNLLRRYVSKVEIRLIFASHVLRNLNTRIIKDKIIFYLLIAVVIVTIAKCSLALASRHIKAHQQQSFEVRSLSTAAIMKLLQVNIS